MPSDLPPNLDDKIRGFEKKYVKGDAAEQAGSGGDNMPGSRVAYELLIATFFFGGIGFLIDRQFHTTPIFLLTLFFVGFATGVYNAWRSMQGFNNKIGLQKDSSPPDAP